jgi:LytS/YehU family sensor histidine kinase
MHGWEAPEITTTVVTGILASYFFLFAVRFAEFGVPDRRAGWRRYAVAAAVATVASVALETTLITLLPSEAGWNFVPDLTAIIPKVTWSAANWSLSGGLAVAVYARFQAARRAREALAAAEIERAVSSRELLATRLAAMQAQVEPQFLLSAMAQIEALYDRDVESGDRMLESLTAYLRASLPQLRGDNSTLEREARLCESYLRMAQLRMGSRLVFSIDIPEDLGPDAFPPMLLLPLVDDALRNGLEPLPFGGRIDLRASADADRLRVVVTHDGVIPPKDPTRTPLLGTLSERLEGLYGARAELTFTGDVRQGVRVAVELPNEAARDHR